MKWIEDTYCLYIKPHADNVLAVLGGETLAFGSAFLTGAFEFGLVGLKAFIVAVMGGLGGMFGKWLWSKITKK